MSKAEEEYDYQREEEPDEQTIYMHTNRSRYFFAMMSFLVALLFLSVYLNNFYDLISGWLLLLGIFAFGAIGVFFLLPYCVLNHSVNTGRDYQGSEIGESMTAGDEERVDEGEYVEEDKLSPFERLVKEALAS